MKLRFFWHGDSCGGWIGKFWFCLRFPSKPLFYSERYGGEPGLRFLGFRLHARMVRNYTTAPQSAPHSAKSDPGKGQTPETP